MPHFSTLKKTAKHFAENERGNFAMLTAVGGVMIMTAVGLSVDVSRALTAQTHLSNAVDAAVLSTTSLVTLGALTEDQAKEEVQKFLFANFDSNRYGTDPTITQVTLDSTANTMSVSAYIDMPTAFLGIAGVQTQRINWTSEAAFSNQEIEVAMALDITGSMRHEIESTGEKKIDALKDAANGAIDALIPNNAAKDRVRIGLVPYAETVDAGPVISRIATTGSGDCVYERNGPNATNDTFANGSNPLGSSTDDCPDSELMPLTNDTAKLKAHINSFDTGGCTAGHVAVAWAHYMLSPNWNAAWDSASEVAAYGDANTRKYAIIMTDGIFNTYVSTDDVCDNDGKALSRADALALCGEMKSHDIKVYTIAFAAPSGAAQLMQNCATPNTVDSQYYFNAEDGDDLKNAFLAIAKDIQSLRLTG